MATPKPAFGHQRSYALVVYNPSKEEMDKVISGMEKVTKTKSNASFRKTMWQLITILRFKTDHYNNAPKEENVLAEVECVGKSLKEVKKIFDTDTGINPDTYSCYSHELIRRQLVGDKDPIANLYLLCDLVLDITDAVEKRIKEGQKRNKTNSFRTPKQTRQIAAEELARALDSELGVKPGKTRGGVFDKCLRILLNAVSCTIEGKKISLPPPSDTFHIIKSAVDTYPKKPKLSFLEVEKFPGLTE